MMKRPDVDYTVVLVFPGFGAEREFAESLVESAGMAEHLQGRTRDALRASWEAGFLQLAPDLSGLLVTPLQVSVHVLGMPQHSSRMDAF